METFFTFEPGNARFFLLIYTIVISIITFFYFGWDKMRAELDKRRVSEKMLWCLTFFCGSFGALLGMYFFRHKTKKLSFQAGLAIILSLQILAAIWFFKN